MRLLITGDREWSSKRRIYDLMATLPKDTVIIHGRARGADSIAATCALELGLAIDRAPTTTDKRDPAHLGGYPARWDKYGRAAGPIRNTEMLRDGLPDVVWAFHDAFASSKGTKDMVTQSLNAGLPVTLYTSDRAIPILQQQLHLI